MLAPRWPTTSQLVPQRGDLGVSASRNDRDRGRDILALSTGLIATAPRADRVVSALQRRVSQRLRGRDHEPSVREKEILRLSRRFSRVFLLVVGLYAYGMTAYLVITQGVK